MLIVGRDEWGALPPVRRHLIDLPTPELWLHHSAGAGADEPTVRRIQDFHMAPPPVGRGWSDIAYSFLLDNDAPDVDVFEGRGAGVAGGHTKGRNTVSHGLCVIGNYMSRPPHDDTLGRLIDFVVFGHRQGWWPGRITGGHRDAPGAATQCPGDALWRLIPTLNAEIRRRLEDGMADKLPVQAWAREAYVWALSADVYHASSVDEIRETFDDQREMTFLWRAVRSLGTGGGIARGDTVTVEGVIR